MVFVHMLKLCWYAPFWPCVGVSVGGRRVNTLWPTLASCRPSAGSLI